MLSSIFKNKWEIFVAGRSRPKGSMHGKVDDNGAVYLHSDPKVRAWERHVREVVKEVWEDGMLDGNPVGLKLTFYFRRPKTVNKKERPFMIMTPDTDKLIRAIGDALTGVCFSDDKFITDIAAKKRYIDYLDDREEGVEICIQW